MNYPDEDYVRYYTRETVSWRALGWEGQTVLALMLHGKFDRSGVFDCDGHDPSHAVTLVTGLPAEVVAIGLKRLLDAKTWSLTDGRLIWPKFIEAQTCRRTDRARQEESRRNRRDSALGFFGDDGHSESPSVTVGHTPSQPVTPSRAEPNQAERGHAPRPKAKPREPRLETLLPDPFDVTQKHLEHAAKKSWPEWWFRNRFESFCEKARAKGWRYKLWDSALYDFMAGEIAYKRGPTELSHLAPRPDAGGNTPLEIAARRQRAADIEARAKQQAANGGRP